MEQNPSWEANSSSASQGIPCIWWNLKVHDHVHNSPQLVPILCQIHPVHTLPPISFTSIFILCFHLHLQSGLFSSGFLTTTPYTSLFSCIPATHLAKINFWKHNLSTICPLNANIICCYTIFNQFQSFKVVWPLHLVYNVQVYCTALYLCAVH